MRSVVQRRPRFQVQLGKLPTKHFQDRRPIGLALTVNRDHRIAPFIGKSLTDFVCGTIPKNVSYEA